MAADKTGTHEVGDAALQALEGRVLALRTVAADEIEAFIKLRDQGGNVSGIVLQVAVERDDDVAFRAVDASMHGGALAAVFFKDDHTHPVATLHAGERLVFGAVIDQHQLVITSGQRGVDLLLHLHDIVLLIIKRHDDRDGG